MSINRPVSVGSYRKVPTVFGGVLPKSTRCTKCYRPVIVTLNVIMLSVVILLVVVPNMPLHQSRVSRLTIHVKLTNKVVLIRSYQSIPITHLST
jgi:hypothetical protein